ncbi:MAG TPA: hypothetical protein VFA46_08440 [Actinomycetes bacterium]|nr:hypothetical protein [Actinomycetes bacterium]
MTSTRRQDLQHTRGEFARRFPDLLNAEPDVAARALVAVVETPPAHPESGGEGESDRYPITFETIEGYLHPTADHWTCSAITNPRRQWSPRRPRTSDNSPSLPAPPDRGSGPTRPLARMRLTSCCASL